MIQQEVRNLQSVRTITNERTMQQGELRGEDNRESLGGDVL
jgi:hypothetical protein